EQRKNLAVGSRRLGVAPRRPRHSGCAARMSDAGAHRIALERISPSRLWQFEQCLVVFRLAGRALRFAAQWLLVDDLVRRRVQLSRSAARIRPMKTPSPNIPAALDFGEWNFTGETCASWFAV